MSKRFKVTAVTMTALLSVATTAPIVRADEEPPPTTTTTVPEVTITVVDTPAPEQETPATFDTDVDHDDDSDSAVSESPTTTAASTDSSTTLPDPSGSEASEGTTAVDASTTTLVTGDHHTGDQDTVVTGTQVVIANSGGNEIVNQGPTGPPTGDGSNSVGTGTADAVGSRDVNNVAQTADIVLTDNAIANILQLALILNVGVALSNSGLNGVVSTPDGIGQSGIIGTGNANAVGNDAGVYALQAANGTAGPGGTDDDSQNALSLWMGLALSNSGLNAINGTGTTGSGGDIGTGNAQAIGNDSLTDIGQHAIANGSGDSVIDIAQRAAVLNLGFALANSGINDISGAAGALLAANDETDDAISEQLFTMLLPALLEANGFGVGSGQIGTGNATAVGNQSQTFIQQIAAATASGDGIASIAQDIIIANVGAAGANTGGNTLGRSLSEMTPAQASAIVSLAAFLSAMLAQVHGVMSGKALDMSEAGLDVPFGDLVLQINGRLSSADSTYEKGGTKANIRQITIIISLGVAKSNTGQNAAVSTQSQDNVARGVEVNTPEAIASAAAIQSGNTDAVNTNLIIICQRIDADDIACLAPPPEPIPDDPGDDPTTPPAPQPEGNSPTPGDPADPVLFAPIRAAVIPEVPKLELVAEANGTATTAGALPSTGSDLDTPMKAGMSLIALGVMLVTFGRRRPSRAR